MPIKTLAVQRRAREIGRIRIGVQTPVMRDGQQLVRHGKPVTRPAALSTFRFTTQDQTTAVKIAEQFGGEARRWEGAPVGEQWEVVTDASAIDVIIPPGESSTSQWMEMWTRGGCLRRCDGETETLTGSPCKCPTDADARRELAARGDACTPHTRVSVILPDLPDIGVWRLETQGFYAALELGGVADFLAQAGAQGIMVPAKLRIEQRERRTVNPASGESLPPKRFAVPVLSVAWTPREIAAVTAGDRPPLQAALTAGAPDPAPAALPAPRAAGALDDADPGSVPARVEACGDMAALTAFAKELQARGWMDQRITVAGESVLIRDLLWARRAVLEQEPVDAEVVDAVVVDDPGEYDPTNDPEFGQTGGR